MNQLLLLIIIMYPESMLLNEITDFFVVLKNQYSSLCGASYMHAASKIH